MIVSPDGNLVLSSRRWPDEGALWICSTRTQAIRTVRLSKARWLHLVEGQGGFFALVHRLADGGVLITAHHCATPEEIAGRIMGTGAGLSLDGPLGIWSALPRAFIVTTRPYNGAGQHPFTHALVVAPSTGLPELVPLRWYEGNYGPEDQPIETVTQLPGTDLIILSVRSDSAPVLFDLASQTRVGSIPLAGRLGIAQLRFRRTAPELWAIDYDTVLRLEARNWTVLQSRRLQEDVNGKRFYLGDFAFDSLENTACVARPGSADVLLIDTRHLDNIRSLPVVSRPLEVAVGDDRIFGRTLDGKFFQTAAPRGWP